MREREDARSEIFIVPSLMGSTARFGAFSICKACFNLASTLYTMSASTNTTTRPVVFMDVSIGETPAGRMKMELFSDIAPKSVDKQCAHTYANYLIANRTAENFRQLCTGEFRFVHSRKYTPTAPLICFFPKCELTSSRLQKRDFP